MGRSNGLAHNWVASPVRGTLLALALALGRRPAELSPHHSERDCPPGQSTCQFGARCLDHLTWNWPLACLARRMNKWWPPELARCRTGQPQWQRRPSTKFWRDSPSLPSLLNCAEKEQLFSNISMILDAPLRKFPAILEIFIGSLPRSNLATGRGAFAACQIPKKKRDVRTCGLSLRGSLSDLNLRH